MFRPLVFLVTLALATATNKDNAPKKHLKTSDDHPKHAVKPTSAKKQVKSFSICTEPGGEPAEIGAELNYWGNVYDCYTGKYLHAYTTITCAPYEIEGFYTPAMTCAAALIFEDGEGIWFDISMLTNDLLTDLKDPVFTTAVVSTTKAGFKQKTDIEVIVDNFDLGFGLTFHYKFQGWNPYYYYKLSDERWNELKATCRGGTCNDGYAECGGNPNCLCARSAEGTGFCAENDLCANLKACQSSGDCVKGQKCLIDTCCGAAGVCANGCPGVIGQAAPVSTKGPGLYWNGNQP